MNQDYFHRVSSRTSTRFWINNVTRAEAQQAVAAGATGCTQNPSFPWKILNDPTDGPYAKEMLDEILANEPDDNEALTQFQKILVDNICKYFLPMYEKSGGALGWVSIQGNPFREDVDSIVRYAHYHRDKMPNIIAKVPATKNGLIAMRILLRDGIPLLATEVMSIDQAMDVCTLYEEETMNLATPPVMYMAHIAGIFDEHLQETAGCEITGIDQDSLWHAGIAVAKKIDEMMRCRKSNVHLLSGGARGLNHFTEMVGANAVVTINWKGTAESLLEDNLPVVERFGLPTPFIVTDALLEKVEDFRKAYIPKSLTQDEYEDFGPIVRFRNSFETAWSKCLTLISERRKQLT